MTLPRQALSWIRNLALDRARRHRQWAREKDPGFLVTHATGEVPVGGADAR